MRGGGREEGEGCPLSLSDKKEEEEEERRANSETVCLVDNTNLSIGMTSFGLVGPLQAKQLEAAASAESAAGFHQEMQQHIELQRLHQQSQQMFLQQQRLQELQVCPILGKER